MIQVWSGMAANVFVHKELTLIIRDRAANALTCVWSAIANLAHNAHMGTLLE